MKRIWLTLALMGACLLAPSSRADNVALTAIMRTHRMSAMEAAAVVVIADALNLNADFVISTGRGSGVSPILYGPAFIYSHHTHRPFIEVWRERKQGWGEIAHSIGMHPGTFNKLRKNGYSVNEVIWMDTMHRCYGIPHGDYGTWRRRGYTDGRIFEIAVRNDGNRSKIGSTFSKSVGKGKGGPPGHAKGKGSSGGHGKGGPPGKGGGNSKGKGGPSGKGGPPGKGGGHGKGRGG